MLILFCQKIFVQKNILQNTLELYWMNLYRFREIVLRADKYHQHYMRTLPLHHSQKEIYACDDYADFELALRPTYDFYMKLMSFGNMIKVLEPKSLQEKIYKWLEKTIEVYK